MSFFDTTSKVCIVLFQTMQKNNDVVISWPWSSTKMDLHCWDQKNNIVSKKHHLKNRSVNSANNSVSLVSIFQSSEDYCWLLMPVTSSVPIFIYHIISQDKRKYIFNLTAWYQAQELKQKKIRRRGKEGESFLFLALLLIFFCFHSEPGLRLQYKLSPVCLYATILW